MTKKINYEHHFNKIVFDKTDLDNFDNYLLRINYNGDPNNLRKIINLIKCIKKDSLKYNRNCFDELITKCRIKQVNKLLKEYNITINL